MLFWLKKAATIPFLPLYFALVIGLSGTVLLWFRRGQRWGRSLVTLALTSLLVFSNRTVARLLLQPVEHQYSAIPEVKSPAELPADLKACRAIVVLGGGHADAPELSRVNQLSSSALSRIAEATRLSRLLPEAKFVVSGHHIEGLSHAQVLGEAAFSLGVAAERIVRMDDPRDTEDEINELAHRFGSAPVALVTSAWHMPRAMQLCRAAGVHAVACPADFMSKLEDKPSGSPFACDLESLEQSTKAIHERLGSLWLKLRGK